MQFGEDTMLTCHVMGGLHCAAEGWTSQHEFAAAHSSVTQPHQVSQIGMTSGELFDCDCDFLTIAEVFMEKWPQTGEIEFFASSHGSGLITD
jgi:hypothetical protein